MKQLFIVSFALAAWTAGFSQEVRDHRTGSGSRPKTNPVPVNPPPVASKPKPGPVATSIDPGKWYYIRKSGTDKYMEISGHRDPARSMAYLAVEDLKQDNTSQQWRINVEVIGGLSVYKIQNRKYWGDLFHQGYNFIIESRRGNTNSTYFNLLPNTDKTWYINIAFFRRKCQTLTTENAIEDHCAPYRPKPIVGGRVLDKSECASKSRREYVYAKRLFNVHIAQKWILEEVNER